MAKKSSTQTTTKSEPLPYRKKPRPEVQRQLFADSAGQCQICYDNVMEDTDLGYYPFMRGEMAHIVGQSTDAASPRGNYALGKDLRDEADNLMLLCGAHHATIDAAVAREDFTVELLRKLKQQHQNDIKHVTSLLKAQRTCIIRVVSSIRGKVTHITKAECNSATLHHKTPRFADFALDIHRQGVEIDLSGFGEPEGNPILYWENVQNKINRQLLLVKQGIEEGGIEHLSIFGLARIPTLIYLGFELGNKVGSTLFQRRRVDSKHWHWVEEASENSFEWELVQTGSDSDRVALIMNVSGSIDLRELPQHIDASFCIFRIKPVGCTPSTETVLAFETLEQFRVCYRQWLAHAEVKHKLAPSVHLFPAVPTGIAVLCGADLMPHSQPEIIVYDRQPSEFKLALTINSKII